MFNFTFAKQSIIVYVYLCSNFQEIAMPNANIKLCSAHCRRVQPLSRGYSPGARGSYPALRVKVFFFADSGSPECRLQFPGG